MTITEPNNAYPLPVENAICYGISEQKYLQDEGRANLATFVFPSSQPNADGDEIVIMGYTFTVDSTSGSTSTTWNGGSNSGIINAGFFRDMLNKSFQFVDFIVELNTDEANPRVLLYSKGNFNVQNWDEIDDSGLTNGIVGAVVNGQAPQYVNAFRILYRMEFFDGTNWCPVCNNWNAAPVPVGADYSPLTLDVDVHGQLSNLVKTRTPKLSQTAVELDQTITKLVRLRASSRQLNNEGALAYGDVLTTDEATIVNAALQVDGPSDFSGYTYQYGAGNNDVSGKFWTSRPQVSVANKNENIWLWAYANLQSVYEAEGETVSAVVYTLETKFYNENGLLGSSETTVANNDGVLIIPAGPANGIHPLTTQPLATRYEITLMGVATIGSGDTRDLNVTETMVIHINSASCEEVQLFFLSPRGGYDTLTFNRTNALEITTQMQEICIDEPCGGDIIDTGKSQFGGVSAERLVLETTGYQKNTALRRYLRDFKISESRFILAQDEDGQNILRRFLVEPGTLRVWQDGEKLRLSVAGTYGNELKQQSQG